MATWQTAITTRTQSDVDYVKSLLNKKYETWTDSEKNAWNKGLNGAFNSSDNSRIQNNLQLLCDVLELNYTVNSLSYFPTESKVREWITICQEIRQNSPMLYDNTPLVPEYPLNTYQKWNDFEKILEDVYIILSSNFYYYSGESNYTGSEMLI